ncbi:MAG: MarR family winged helix-turn-helix transcriptional regulator, partial [Candidatus Weimeria sp.]
IKQVTEAIEKRINEQNRPFHLTLAQGRIVMYLAAKEEQTAPQSELMDLLGVAHTTMIRILQSMKNKGMIEIAPNEQDHRSNDVRLLYGSPEIYKKLQDNAEDNENVLLSGFSKEEIDAFSSFLDRAYRNLISNPPVV